MQRTEGCNETLSNNNQPQSLCIQGLLFLNSYCRLQAKCPNTLCTEHICLQREYSNVFWFRWKATLAYQVKMFFLLLPQNHPPSMIVDNYFITNRSLLSIIYEFFHILYINYESFWCNITKNAEQIPAPHFTKIYLNICLFYVFRFL